MTNRTCFLALLLIGCPLGSARAEASLDRMTAHETRAARTASTAVLKTQRQQRDEVRALSIELENKLRSLRDALWQAHASSSEIASTPPGSATPEQNGRVVLARSLIRSRLEALADERAALQTAIPRIKAPSSRLMATRAAAKLQDFESETEELLEETDGALNIGRLHQLIRKLRIERRTGGTQNHRPDPSVSLKPASEHLPIPGIGSIPGRP